MTSAPRGTLADHLITPQNAAFRSSTTSPLSSPRAARWITRCELVP